MPTRISAFADLADRYEGFIFDVWGTLYDGGAAFPDALAAVASLASAGKKLLVLSNSPRIPAVVDERLSKIGFDTSRFTGIETSGGMVADIVGGRRDAESTALGGKVLWLGKQRFPDTLPDGVFTEVADAGEADWVLNAGPDGPESVLEDYERVLTEAAAVGLPMVCANPDKTVFQGGVRLLCAGLMAERYETLGGNVRYFGKPYPEIFGRCLDRLQLPAEKVLVVGDNLETDILGASRTGMDSLLLASGVHAADMADAESLEALTRLHAVRPSYYAASLA